MSAAMEFSSPLLPSIRLDSANIHIACSSLRGLSPLDGLWNDAPPLLGVSASGLLALAALLPRADLHAPQAHLAASAVTDAILDAHADPAETALLTLLLHLHDDQNQPLVAPATVFLAHAWHAPLVGAVEAALVHARSDPAAYFWLDIICLPPHMPQCARIAWAAQLPAAMRRIGNLLFVVDPWGSDHGPRRCARSLWQLYSAVLEDVEACMHMPLEAEAALGDGALAGMHAAGLAAWASTSLADAHESGLVEVLRAAEATAAGTLQHVDEVLREELTGWLLGCLEQLADDLVQEESPAIVIAEGPLILAPGLAFVRDFYAVGAGYWARMDNWEMAQVLLQSLLAVDTALFGAGHAALAPTLKRLSVAHRHCGSITRALLFGFASLSPAQRLQLSLHSN
jgi:hypothetical protein